MKNKPDKSKIKFFIMRHGEPEKYGVRNSPLSENGKKQINTKASAYLARSKNDHERNVKIFYSSRKRAKESAQILFRDINYLISKKGIKNFKIESPKPRKIMQTADTLQEIINLGYSVNDACEAWIDMSEDKLKLFGIQTPEEMRTRFINFIIENGKKYSKNPSSSIDIFGITHETTLLAFQRKLFPKLTSKPDYAEIMEAGFKKNGSLYFIFRGNEVIY